MGNEKRHNTVETITFIVGLLLILPLIGFLIYQISTKKKAPPQLQITSLYQPQMEDYGFRVEVENTGEESAEAVNIKLALYQEGEVADDGEISIQYVPVKSKETAWIVFHTRKKPGDSLVVSSVTYVKP